MSKKVGSPLTLAVLVNWQAIVPSVTSNDILVTLFWIKKKKNEKKDNNNRALSSTEGRLKALTGQISTGPKTGTFSVGPVKS